MPFILGSYGKPIQRCYEICKLVLGQVDRLVQTVTKEGTYVTGYGKTNHSQQTLNLRYVSSKFGTQYANFDCVRIVRIQKLITLNRKIRSKK